MALIHVLLLAGAAAAMPAIPTVTTTVTMHAPSLLTTPSPSPEPLTTPAPGDPSTPVSCHYKYCDGSTSWCLYWAGITAYDLTHGPQPGERRTDIGPCPVPTTTPTPQTTP